MAEPVAAAGSSCLSGPPGRVGGSYGATTESVAGLGPPAPEPVRVAVADRVGGSHLGSIWIRVGPRFQPNRV